MLPHFIATIDELIKDHVQKINPDNLALLKRIVFHHSSTIEKKGLSIVDSGINIESLSGKYKRSYIATDGTLHIIINDQYELNK